MGLPPRQGALLRLIEQLQRGPSVQAFRWLQWVAEGVFESTSVFFKRVRFQTVHQVWPLKIKWNTIRGRQNAFVMESRDVVLQVGNPRYAVLIGDAEEYTAPVYQEFFGAAQNDSPVLESVIVLAGRRIGQYKIYFSLQAFQFTAVCVGKRLEGVGAHEFGFCFDLVQSRVFAGCSHIVFSDVESNYAVHPLNATGSDGETSTATSPIDADAVKQVFVYTDGLN